MMLRLRQCLSAAEALAGPARSQLQITRGTKASSRQVEVILREDIFALGAMGDIVRVQPGHARNKLIPQKQAVYATKANVAAFPQWMQQQLQRLSDEEAAARREALQQAAQHREQHRQQQRMARLLEKLHNSSVTVRGRKIDLEGALAEAVTAAEVSKLVRNQLSIELPEELVLLPEPLSQPGDHLVDLRLEHEGSALQLHVYIPFTSDTPDNAPPET